MKLQLVVNGSTAGGNGAPSTVAHGVPIRRGSPGLSADDGLDDASEEGSLVVEGTVSSGAGTISYGRIWGWFENAAHATNKWCPLGTGSDADKGKINGGAPLGETHTDLIRHTERLRGFREPSRLYFEYGVLTNVSRVDATLVVRGAK